MLVRIADIEAALELQRAEERAEKLLLVRIADLEAALESQRAEIESSKNTIRLYEVAVEAQRLTIETFQKLCRLYEAREQMNERITANKVNPECR